MRRDEMNVWSYQRLTASLLAVCMAGAGCVLPDVTRQSEREPSVHRERDADSDADESDAAPTPNPERDAGEVPSAGDGGTADAAVRDAGPDPDHDADDAGPHDAGACVTREFSETDEEVEGGVAARTRSAAAFCFADATRCRETSLGQGTARPSTLCTLPLGAAGNTDFDGYMIFWEPDGSGNARANTGNLGAANASAQELGRLEKSGEGVYRVTAKPPWGLRFTTDDGVARRASESTCIVDVAAPPIPDLSRASKVTMCLQNAELDPDGATSTAPPELPQWDAPGPLAAGNVARGGSNLLAIDGLGNTFAVWDQLDGATYSLWVARRVPVVGWGAAQLLVSGLTVRASHSLAADQLGNATLIWSDKNSVLMTSRYAVDQGWSAAAPLVNGATGSIVKLAMNARGDAVATWSTLSSLQASRSFAGMAWTAPVAVDTKSVALGAVAIDAVGNSIAVWSDRMRMNASTWPADSGVWTAATPIDAAGGVAQQGLASITQPRLALDGAGNALAVWHWSDGMRLNVWANRYVSGSGWGTPEALDTENLDDASAPSIAMTASGNAIAIWQQAGVIWGKRYLAARGWGSPTRVQASSAGGFAYQPAIAMDRAGNAVAIWSYQGVLEVSRFAVGVGWSPTSRIDDQADTVDQEFPAIVASQQSGEVVAAWERTESKQTQIWSSRIK